MPGPGRSNPTSVPERDGDGLRGPAHAGRGEPAGRRLDWDALLLRIHPAASRVALLATQTPATTERLRLGPMKIWLDGSLIGRTAAGVKGIALAPEDGVGFVLPDDEEGEVLLVSDKGFMKRCLLIDFDLQARAGKGVKCFAFQKNGANGTRICAALLVKQPFDFVAKQKSGQEMPLNTNAVRIERRDSRGSMYAMCVLDDTIEFVERTIQRGN